MSEYVPDEMPPSVGEQWKVQAHDALGEVVMPAPVLGFLRAIVEVNDDFDLIYFFEKPWKWEREMSVWLSAGSPNPDDLSAEEYDSFVARLESAS